MFSFYCKNFYNLEEKREKKKLHEKTITLRLHIRKTMQESRKWKILFRIPYSRLRVLFSYTMKWLLSISKVRLRKSIWQTMRAACMKAQKYRIAQMIQFSLL